MFRNSLFNTILITVILCCVLLLLYRDEVVEFFDSFVLPIGDATAIDYLTWRGKSMTKEEMNLGQKKTT